MSGNVSEWVQDCRNLSYRGAPVDGRAWEKGDCIMRVWSGGSRSYGPRHLRAASRFWTYLELRFHDLGFRIARTLVP